MDKSSPLDTLRQLRELLDAGTITPQEFEMLKSRLLAAPAVAPDSRPAPLEAATPSALPTHPEPEKTPPLVLGPPFGATAGAASPVPDSSSPEPYGQPSWPEAPLSAEKSALLTPPVPPIAPNPPLRPEPGDEDAGEEPARSPLGKILAIGGGLLLVLLIWYLVLGQSRSSEHLTSTSQTAADTVAVAPDTGPQAEQLELPPITPPETVRIAPVVPPTTAPDSTTAVIVGSVTGDAQPAAAPTENADEATSRVRDVLASYYTDMQAPPFSADHYFAPQVELFVILRNTTPAAIAAWLDENRFPEFKDAQAQVEPGTLRVGPAATDGSRVATYIEQSQAFRQSLQKNQNTRAQMRLRVNADYKITYQKQERLLENILSDVAPQ
ncbi:MAG: SHOCT domain-containing protein [Hymenobacter sp.]|nr:SHOCT domain-containing protein [Hymenobacter sp.]